jgi:two-component system phosphate regulon response regulator OmpR
VANVLVVDDEAGVRANLRRMLAKLGHEAWEAADGAEALRLLGGVRFDIVITDAYMAEMDGMELLVRIQQRGLHMPVVMISGGGYMAREEVLAMGKGCGAVATLDKPFTAEQLRQTIEPLLQPLPQQRARGE